ncbi:MAG: ATP-binding cassette domain-containing protein [Planctomycetota bacterium]|nr:ATP-binding cassette domain-containing protein [Planctomycetota bacterium]
MGLLSLHDVTVSFGGPPILENANLQIERGERVGLLGRNGAGKTTLMKLLLGEIVPDRGEIAREQGSTVARLVQEVPRDLPGTVFDEVSRGLGELSLLVTEYHHVVQAYSADPNTRWQKELDRLQHTLEREGGWHLSDRVDRVIEQMGLSGDAEVASLSAGMKRRVLLAKALVLQPDLLLLDEPTNHLDIDSIEWLESFLARYDGTVLFVTHDRMFLRRLATRILEIDRGRLTSWSCDHETYLVRKQAALDAEAQQNALFDKKLALEETWIRTGIKARRTRNEGRVRALEELRRQRQARREVSGDVRIASQDAERSGRRVIDAKNITVQFGDHTVIRDFFVSIARGDKFGILGPNGAGKSTLLRTLLGELQPQAGEIQHGTRLEIAYFDQLHAQLDENKSVLENVTDGSDRVTVGGKSRHIIGYLEDFLFPPEQSRSLVKFLSGGERNRLLLARLFTKPSNVLVLDEPTNDLDIETLDLLESLLVEYTGTVLLVSHDREFVNNVVTSTLAFEGDGVIKEYVGGYDDWQRQRKPTLSSSERAGDASSSKQETSSGTTVSTTAGTRTADKPRKLSYKEQQELAALPQRIASLEQSQQEMHAAMAEPGYYQQSGEQLSRGKLALEKIDQELAAAYVRWEELEVRS